jgi:beta-galactosidase|uniref:glycoside hydrolase family 2 TIM barrel-domain containing protein n=1 Tax=Bacteroides finegoldii TaxID=338188 RepID=UPI0035654946
MKNIGKADSNREKRLLLFFMMFFVLYAVPAFAQKSISSGILVDKNKVCVSGKESGRSVQLFNFDWRFQMGNLEGVQAVGYDDSNWRILDLPHDFQIEMPWSQKASGGRGFKEMGEGWYRKTFQANSDWKGKKVLLDFEGVVTFGDVWFNGKKVAEMDYGYLGCEADITKYVNYNGENVVAVYTSTGEKDGQRWYTGGGLFRDVHLVIKDTVSIARHGIFITTPKVSEQKAEVNVQVELEGISNKQLDVEIDVVIFSPNGEQVAESRIFAPKGRKTKTVEIPLPVIAVAAPLLWSCETPHLYTAEVCVKHGGKIVDRVIETFGIRTIEFSPKFGLHVNGEKVFLKGVAGHHDLGALGAAVYDKAVERFFKQLKAFGVNSIRLTCNPYSESFMDMADKYGILIIDELCDKWCGGRYWPGKTSFFESFHTIIPEWIKRDRNHPSVLLWSLGNELQMREELAGFPTGDWGVTTYKILDILVKRYDPTRKTTVAMFPSRADGINKHDPGFKTNYNAPELSLVTDIASYNYQYHVYPEYLKRHPELIIYQSEAGSIELSNAYFSMDYDRMVGLAYWGAVEYWGETSGWPRKGWTYSYFNHALNPYPQAYVMKSLFCDEPLVHIGVVDNEREAMELNDIIVGREPVSSHWNRTPGSNLNLFTYTNAEEVELIVNGKSLGVKKNGAAGDKNRNMILWKDVPYGKGGKVVAIARSQGNEVARHHLETTGKAIALKMEAEGGDWLADGMDIQYVRLYAVDNKGRVVPTFNGEVVFDVSGAARLIAVDNGDHSTDKIFCEGGNITMFNGFAMAILRSDKYPGDVKVKATSEELKGSELKLSTAINKSE